MMYEEITKAAYEQMEMHLIRSMKRNLGRHIDEELKTGRDYPQWQAIKLRELRKYQRQNKQIVNRSVGKLPDDVAKHLETQLKQSGRKALKEYCEKNGIDYKSIAAVENSFFHINERKLEALQNSIENDLTIANHACLRMINDEYRSTIYKYELFLANGVYTPTQAYDAAVKDFLERGINCIEYKDGRRVNIADYTDMAIKTANKRAQLMGEGSFRQWIKHPLIIVSAHNTTCPLCAPFQRKVLIDDVYSGGTQSDGDYMLLSEAMKKGLFHPRCRHGVGTYYPEIEDLNGYETRENILNDYGKANTKAHANRMIKKYSRLIAGSIDSENIQKYKQLYDFWKNKAKSIDNSRKNDIISLSSKYVNSSEDLYRRTQLIEPIQDYEDIVIHGNEYGFCVNDSDGKEIISYTPREFAQIIKSNPNYKGGKIRLISCKTGSPDGYAAQILANELNVDVLAPSDVVYIDFNGNMEIGEFDAGEWILYKPRR